MRRQTCYTWTWSLVHSNYISVYTPGNKYSYVVHRLVAAAWCREMGSGRKVALASRRCHFVVAGTTPTPTLTSPPSTLPLTPIPPPGAALTW